MRYYAMQSVIKLIVQETACLNKLLVIGHADHIALLLYKSNYSADKMEITDTKLN
jgi:hypothetical protein